MVAEVIINRTAKKLNRTFDYKIPQKLEDYIIVGSKVLVPFGKSEKLEDAFVVNIKERSDYDIKEIKKIQNGLTDKQISLSKWMANRYFCNVSDCIKLMLTPGTRNKQKIVQDKIINVVYLKKDIEEIEFDIKIGKLKSDKQKRIIQFVKSNEGVTISEIEIFTNCSRAIVNTLVKNGYLQIIERKIERNPLQNKNVTKTHNLTLNEEQQKAYSKIENAIENNHSKEFLLFGVTGSRKNRNISTSNTKSNRKRKNSNSISSRNIFNSSNDRSFYFKIWKR